MKYKILLPILLFTLTMNALESSAQRRKGKSFKSRGISRFSGRGHSGGSAGHTQNYWAVGLSLNTTTYYGDLSPSSSKISNFIELVPDGFGVLVKKKISSGIFFRGAFNTGVLDADDAEASPTGGLTEESRIDRNLSFRNKFTEISGGVEIELFRTNGPARGRAVVNPYLFVGVAAINHAPEAQAPATDQAGQSTGNEGKWIDLQSIGTAGQGRSGYGAPYSKLALAIPVALGVKYKVTDDIDINLEFGYRYTFTDYLDDVGNDNYADLGIFENDNTARSLSYRGGEISNAGVFTGSNGVDYRVNQKVAGPSFTGQKRGGKALDSYITTQISVVYIINQQTGRSVRGKRGKFR